MRGQPSGDAYNTSIATFTPYDDHRTAITGPRGNHVMTRTEQAIQRRRMTRKIRETVALRRYTATLSQVSATETAATEPDVSQPSTS